MPKGTFGMLRNTDLLENRIYETASIGLRYVKVRGTCLQDSFCDENAVSRRDSTS
jgi:hypothetical protein